jgi:hypothetical protein
VVQASSFFAYLAYFAGIRFGFPGLRLPAMYCSSPIYSQAARKFSHPCVSCNSFNLFNLFDLGCGFAALCFSFLTTPLAFSAPEQTAFKFDFGSGKVAPGHIQILPTTVYTRELGYGFDLGSKVTAVDRGGDDPLHGDFCTSDQPFFFFFALS